MHKFVLINCRDVGANKWWMKCTISIDREIIRYGKPIAYKYAIHSPKLMSSRKKPHPYEYLHNCSYMLYGRGPINRCLQIPRDTKGIKTNLLPQTITAAQPFILTQ